MEARDIIIKPVVTEKSVSLMEHNKYVFKVALSANKIEIKKAVEEIISDAKSFGIKPIIYGVTSYYKNLLDEYFHHFLHHHQIKLHLYQNYH